MTGWPFHQVPWAFLRRCVWFHGFGWSMQLEATANWRRAFIRTFIRLEVSLRQDRHNILKGARHRNWRRAATNCGRKQLEDAKLPKLTNQKRAVWEKYCQRRDGDWFLRGFNWGRRKIIKLFMKINDKVIDLQKICSMGNPADTITNSILMVKLRASLSFLHVLPW